MKKVFYIVLGVILNFQFSILNSSCSRPSRVEQYKAEKHIQDSIRLEEQTRSLSFYESQLEALMPTADSLIAFFAYEKNEKYQDHGYYVVRSSAVKPHLSSSYRILVRDDGKEVLIYKDGKRMENPSLSGANHSINPSLQSALTLAEQLRVTITDIKELERRIARTSLEIQKYQKRLNK